MAEKLSKAQQEIVDCLIANPGAHIQGRVVWHGDEWVDSFGYSSIQALVKRGVLQQDAGWYMMRLILAPAYRAAGDALPDNGITEQAHDAAAVEQVASAEDVTDDSDPAPFAVGDRVEVVTNKSMVTKKFVGMCGTIYEVGLDLPYPYGVKFDIATETDESYCFHADELRKLPPVVDPRDAEIARLQAEVECLQNAIDTHGEIYVRTSGREIGHMYDDEIVIVKALSETHAREVAALEIPDHYVWSGVWQKDTIGDAVDFAIYRGCDERGQCYAKISARGFNDNSAIDAMVSAKIDDLRQS